MTGQPPNSFNTLDSGLFPTDSIAAVFSTKIQILIIYMVYSLIMQLSLTLNGVKLLLSS